jgi:flagellar biogenesis protein FliO
MIASVRLALLTVSLTISSAADAQRLGGAADTDISMVRIFLTLFFCLIVAAFAVFLIRQRYGGRMPAMFTRIGSTTARLRLIESRRIAPQSDLCLIECDDREFLLLISPGNALVLKEQPATGRRDS